MPDTPLGSVVSVRAEKDPKVIKDFTKDQKRIRSDWLKRKQAKLKDNPDAYNSYWANMQQAFKSMYS